MRISAIASCFVLLVTSLAASQDSSGVPRFETAPCPVEVEPGERIDCGALLVPENRDKPDSRTIRLPVMIFRSHSASPAPDPLVYVPGGPGGSAVARRRSGKSLPFLARRDFVLLEPRGARFAQPALECPELNRLTGELSAGRLHGDAARSAMLAAAASCRRSLIESGVDLDGYTSAAAADDLEDLRLTLKYPPWNLQGVSYGTRVILTALRRHPEGIRSAVLDSVLPPEVNFDETSAFNLLRAFNLVFDGCAVDSVCGAAFPDVRKQFHDLAARADREPLPLFPAAQPAAERIVVRGAQVVDALYLALHDPAAIPQMPRIIADAAAGRYEELAKLVKANQGPSSFTWGLRLSTWCSEESPFEDPARVATQTDPVLGLGGIDEGTATPELCREWGVKAAPPVENTPVKSEVPLLIFAGEFDPDTPPQWARGTMVGLPGAFYVEMRGQSHVAGFTRCGGEITMGFLDSPKTTPPVDCALKLRGADFSLSRARP